VASLTLAELEPGRSAEVLTPISLADLDAFAALSGDVSALHMDAEFAKGKGFEGRVAHGLLVGSLISRFVGTVMPGDGGLMRRIELDFRNPVIPPDELTIRGEVEKVSQSTGQVTLQIKVLRRDGVVAVSARVLSLVRP
jgi:acyl dehydratase